MKKRNALRKFGRVRKQRKALMISLADALILNEKIKTTEAKAKSLRPFLEKLITKGKKNNLATRKFLSTKLRKQSAKKLFDVISPKYKDRTGGYIRIIKLPRRESDASRMALIEFI